MACCDSHNCLTGVGEEYRCESVYKHAHSLMLISCVVAVFLFHFLRRYTIINHVVAVFYLVDFYLYNLCNQFITLLITTILR